MIREAILAATMNLVPAAPVDVLRFLRVPAIVFTLGVRRLRRPFCTQDGCDRRRHRCRS
jgi:hypothetical protein